MNNNGTNIKPMTLNDVMKRFDEITNAEYDSPVLSLYYYTDNTHSSDEKPLELRCLCILNLNMFKPNENGKFTLSTSLKIHLNKLLTDAYNKENIYLL